MKVIVKAIIAFSIVYPKTVLASTFGGMADNLFVGVNVLTKFFWAACILTGVFLLVGCMVHYKEHRNNPKVVPLFTVIMYLVLGLTAISVPFLNRLFGSDAYDAVNQSKIESSHYDS